MFEETRDIYNKCCLEKKTELKSKEEKINVAFNDFLDTVVGIDADINIKDVVKKMVSKVDLSFTNGDIFFFQS